MKPKTFNPYAEMVRAISVGLAVFVMTLAALGTLYFAALVIPH